MPKTIITPPGSGTPLAPFSPGTLADGVMYVSGTLAFDKQNNVVHIGDAAGQTRHVLETIKSVIETAGGSLDDITFNSIFLLTGSITPPLIRFTPNISPVINRHAFVFNAVWSNPMP